MKINKLNEAFTSDDLYEKLVNFFIDEINANVIDNSAAVAASEVPDYNADWCSEVYNPEIDRAVRNLAEIMSEDLLILAPDIIHESTLPNTNKDNKKLLEGGWNYTLKSGKALRTAIDKEDYAELKNALGAAYKEINKALPEGFDEDELEEKLTDLEFLDLDSDAEDDWNYELSDFYDLCDALRIWVSI